MARPQLFVVPELEGRPTGGTLYNRSLLAALRALGVPLRVAALSAASRELCAAEFDLVWIDSLYLDSAAELRAMLAPSSRLGLLLHYLPALVAFGADVTDAQLSHGERAALGVADLALTTSDFMRKIAIRLGMAERSLLAVEPASELGPQATLPTPASGVRAVLVAHVVSGKGIEPFLLALARALEPSDRWTLRIVGALDAEPAYAARCRELVAREPALCERVSFRGSLPHGEVITELGASNLLLSASAMESYGMALAEGRRAGLPLLARDAGNVREHVHPHAGGELVESVAELAQACVRLCRAPAEHARRLSAAQSHVPALRTWRDAAIELVRALDTNSGHS